MNLVDFRNQYAKELVKEIDALTKTIYREDFDLTSTADFKVAFIFGNLSYINRILKSLLKDYTYPSLGILTRTIFEATVKGLLVLIDPHHKDRLIFSFLKELTKQEEFIIENRDSFFSYLDYKKIEAAYDSKVKSIEDLEKRKISAALNVYDSIVRINEIKGAESFPINFYNMIYVESSLRYVHPGIATVMAYLSPTKKIYTPNWTDLFPPFFLGHILTNEVYNTLDLEIPKSYSVNLKGKFDHLAELYSKGKLVT